MAGDDWEIRVTLLDENNAPYVNPQILWALVDRQGRLKIGSGYSVSTINATSGQYAIIIPAAVTEPLAIGTYTDTIRIIDSGGVTSTLAVGAIHVAADPWSAAIVGQQMINISLSGTSRFKAVAG